MTVISLLDILTIIIYLSLILLIHSIGHFIFEITRIIFSERASDNGLF
jgi:hypothetical protein